jgi:hypothetical protein
MTATEKSLTAFGQHHQEAATTGAQEPPAIVFGPDATVRGLTHAALGRARLLERSLEAWSCADRSSIEPHEVASALHPLAADVENILDHMSATLNRRAEDQADAQDDEHDDEQDEEAAPPGDAEATSLDDAPTSASEADAPNMRDAWEQVNKLVLQARAICQLIGNSPNSDQDSEGAGWAAADLLRRCDESLAPLGKWVYATEGARANHG